MSNVIDITKYLSTRRPRNSQEKQQPPTPEELLEAALRYASLGYPVLPIHGISPAGECECGDSGCPSAGKHSQLRGWQEAVTTDEQTIRGWWAQWPHENVGLVTGPRGGFWALDINLRHAGHREVENLMEKHGDLPVGPLSFVGEEGVQLLFSVARDSRLVPNAANLGDLVGLEVRGEGEYIVAPPSFHASGRRYEWGDGRSLGGIALPAAPTWLQELVLQSIRPLHQV